MPDPDDTTAASGGNGRAPNLPAVTDGPVRGEVLDATPAPLAQRIAELPAPVVAAAGGFLVGVVTFVAFRVIGRAAAAPGRLILRRGRKREAARIEASRSFLVDIHLLKR